MQKEDFAKRLTELRLAKGVSARDMSLSIGQSPNYINTIENNRSIPSMKMFFHICEYLGVTPEQFFDEETIYSDNIKELLSLTRHLNSQQLDTLINLIKFKP